MCVFDSFSTVWRVNPHLRSWFGAKIRKSKFWRSRTRFAQPCLMRKRLSWLTGQKISKQKWQRQLVSKWATSRMYSKSSSNSRTFTGGSENASEMNYLCLTLEMTWWTSTGSRGQHFCFRRLTRKRPTTKGWSSILCVVTTHERLLER